MKEEAKERLNSIKYLFKSKKDNQALTEITKYIEDYPDDAFGKYQYGVILKRLGRYDEANDIFYDLYENDAPNKYSALYELGRMKSIRGEYDYAKFYFNKILDESPYSEVFTIIELSKIERREGNLEKSERLLTEALPLTDNINHKYVLLELIKSKLMRNDVKGASSIIKEIKIDKNDKLNRKVLQYKGKIESTGHNYNQAIKYLEDSLGNRKDDVYWSSILELAKTNYKMGNVEEAHNLCIRLKENKNTFFGDVDILLGNIYSAKGNLERAEQHYLNALKNRGKFIEKAALFNLGNLNMQKGDYPLAKKYYQEVTKHQQLYKAPAYFQLLYLSIREEDYQNCHKIIAELEQLELNSSMKESIEKVKLYLDVKRKAKIKLSRIHNYTDEQIINYSEEKALNFITSNKKRDVSFNEEIDQSTLFYSIKSKLTADKLTINSLMDSYLIEYPSIGYRQDEKLNDLRVICLPNTKDIITMYPDSRVKKTTESIEEEQIEQETSSKKKVKKLSQIDKFNRRYGLKN